LPDNVNVTFDQMSITTQGIAVPLNQSRTLDIQLFSVAETDDWTLDAKDYNYFTGAGPSELQFAFDDVNGNNGDTRKLTITRVANGAIGGTEFVIYSQKSLTDYHAYFALAGN
jgi:hypothetical protein